MITKVHRMVHQGVQTQEHHCLLDTGQQLCRQPQGYYIVMQSSSLALYLHSDTAVLAHQLHWRGNGVHHDCLSGALAITYASHQDQVSSCACIIYCHPWLPDVM